MGDRTNKNKKVMGSENDVKVIVGVVNASGMKQAGSGNTRNKSTVKMGMTQTSRQGNTHTASKVLMKTTTGQSHTGPQNRPQQSHQQRVTNQNHHQNRPPQNKVTQMVPSAPPQQSVNISINLATLLASQQQPSNQQQAASSQKQHRNNQQRNNQQYSNQQHNKVGQQQGRNYGQSTAQGQRNNQQYSNQQHNKVGQQQGLNYGQSAAHGQRNKNSQGMKTGAPVDTKNLQKVFLNLNIQQ